MHRFFFKTHQWLSQRKIPALIGLIVVFTLMILGVTQIKFEEDISRLVPVNEQNKTKQEVLQNMNFADKVIVTIQADSVANSEHLIAYAESFIDSLNTNASDYFTEIQGKVGNRSAFEAIDFVYENLPVFMDSADYKTIENRLQPDSLKLQLESSYKNLNSPFGMISRRTILQDPLGISFLGMEELQEFGKQDQFKLVDGFLVTKNDKNLLLFISPKFPTSETGKNKIFSDYLYQLKTELDTKFEGQASISYFGGMLISVANADQIQSDIKYTVTIALAVLLLIFILFYRKLLVPLILFIPTLFAGLLAIVILGFVRESISAISLGIGSVLLGITLDYALHILTHLRNNASVKAMFEHVTKPLLMSSLTTALAFFCLLFLDSPALQDLGLFAGLSVLVASIFALIFIPLAYRGGLKPAKKQTLLDRISAYQFHKNKILIAGLALLVLVSVFTFNKVKFEKDLSALNFMPEDIASAEKNLEQITQMGDKSVYIASYGTTEEEALKANDLVKTKLEKLQANQKILSYNSIAALVPSAEKQKEKINAWNTFWTDEKIQNTEQNLEVYGTTIGFRRKDFDAFNALLAKDFKPLQLDDYSTLETLPVKDFVSQKNGLTIITTLVKTKEENAKLLASTFGASQNILVVDRENLNETFLSSLTSDFNKLILYSLIAVVLILLLSYRNIFVTLVTLIPIGITWFLTLGIMGIFDLHFNVFNIIITTFIFGLGIDYAIFMTNGLLLKNKQNTELTTYKSSILLSMLTTILGIGVLAFAKHPALQSISLISVIGIFSAVLVVFVVQPILFKLANKLMKKLAN
ncbi:MAG: hypothetical protein CL868_08760 [Cytophagaceae bacterium]|nr:hypothetical protein [Cytophagaceae bacterium]|tara:strand:+ start:9757 stop:12192 length:2436 start_codon:yes stop_codon:yes gene_type:complete